MDAAIRRVRFRPSSMPGGTRESNERSTHSTHVKRRTLLDVVTKTCEGGWEDASEMLLDEKHGPQLKSKARFTSKTETNELERAVV
jgi:hypothetical protein